MSENEVNQVIEVITNGPTDNMATIQHDEDPDSSDCCVDDDDELFYSMNDTDEDDDINGSEISSQTSNDTEDVCKNDLINNDNSQIIA